MPKAFIFGGTGQIARATAAALLDRNWTMVLASRHPTPSGDDRLTPVALDRYGEDAFPEALGQGADLLIDTIGYDAHDAAQLLAVQEDVGHLITISSASVYRDEHGRSLIEARRNGFPVLPVPVTESQATVLPGPESYSARKLAMEQRLLDGARVPATVLRPCAIHGPHSRHPREWWFVKRLLDGRWRIPLAYGGDSRFQTSATVNIAALIARVADARAGGIFNAADPDSPTVTEIGRAVMAALDREAELVPVIDSGYPPDVGATPWSIPHPFVLADEAARALGYQPVADYARATFALCRWLADFPTDAWQSRFPQLAAYPWDQFDYAAEDAWLARQGRR